MSSVIVRAPGDAAPFAHLAVEPCCSVLTTREGLRFEFRPSNLLATRWMMEDQDKHLRVDFRGPGLLSEIVIHAVARVDSTGLALLPLALVTGGYLMAKMVDDLMITITAAGMQG